MNPESPHAGLENAGLGRHAAAIAALARPCVHLRSGPGGDAAGRVGASRLGGEPDLPAGTAWPRWKGASLSFLAQIDLAAIAVLPGADVLPPDGLLSFFYDAEQSTWGFDPADAGSWCVLHTPAAAPLERVRFPAALPDHARFPACTLTPGAALSIPSWEEPALGALGLAGDEVEAYMDFRTLDGVGSEYADDHHILGWPDPVQNGEMELECQLVSGGIYMGGPEGYADPRRAQLAGGAAEWRLLLQLASDPEAEMMWGDMGMLYFWVRERDLAARDFRHVWMLLQCG